VGLKGGDLGLQMIANVNDSGMRREGDRLPIGEGEGSGRIVNLLRLVGGQTIMKLIGIPMGASCPVERERREDAGHGMVGMAGGAAFSAECEHHLWTKAANVQSEVIDDSVQFLPVELSVGIVENQRPGDLQDFAGCGELPFADVGKVLVGFGVAAM